MRFLKAFLASACGWRSLLEEMGNTLGKSGERRGVMLEFENLNMTNLLFAGVYKFSSSPVGVL
ncbi:MULTISPECIES: hypothetical protein [Nostoc]|uniref:Transposase n=2 Tax=Nostoc TaxID=1177 RepID=A0ABR8II75_9NOSO|nr:MULTISPECIES: hypothetical protein [Nostoc]MBD2565230.1 hypothetical protein [Nostoc linckia FACHB-391]MBD2650893.1 hypothetical protein [Nostoc foliaceum FACHB-393]